MPDEHDETYRPELDDELAAEKAAEDAAADRSRLHELSDEELSHEDDDLPGED